MVSVLDLTPEMKAALQQPQVQQIVIMNDTQLVSLMAAEIWKMPGAKTPGEAVTIAIDMVAEAIVQMQMGQLNLACNAVRQRLEMQKMAPTT